MSNNHGIQESSASKNWATQENQAWAQWEYAPAEWALLDRMDWGRVALRQWLAVRIPGWGSLLAVALFFWSSATNGGAMVGFASLIMIVLVLLSFRNLLVFGEAYDKAKKRHQARQNPSQPHRVTLSDQGIWEVGTYFPFAGSGVEKYELGVKLLEVELTSRPTTLHFRVEYLSKHGGGYRSYKNRTQEIIHLLVPGGHESEAEPLAQRFRTGVIEARERAEKQHTEERAHDARANPPEPSLLVLRDHESEAEQVAQRSSAEMIEARERAPEPESPSKRAERARAIRARVRAERANNALVNPSEPS